MTHPSPVPAPGPNPSRFLPLVLLLFAASGCSALIYEIVWYHLLQLAIGSTAVSLGFLLATYMGGLCLGSIALPRMARREHPLRLYAKLELGIAVLALLVLFGLPLVNRVYVAGAAHGFPGMILRGMLCGICLLPPTFLMGASLPAIVRWIKSSPAGVSWWGLLYGGNTVGAVFGCLLAGFYLLRIYDTVVATFVAVAVNLLVALVSLALASRTPFEASVEDAPAAAVPDVPSAVSAAPDNGSVYLAIALSGAGALGAEVVWTRLLGMLMGSTVYVFSIILAVFLIGLALGSSLGAWIARLVRGISGARVGLAWTQLLLMAAVAWAALMIADSLPYWPINPFLAASPWYTFQLDLMRSLWVVLPAALLWGASFPLALAAVRPASDDPARVVGQVYAANTLGAIIGALAVSLWLVPWIGTRNCERLLVVLAAAGAMAVLAPLVRQSRSQLAAAGLVIVAVAGVLLAWRIDPIPGELIAYGRRMATYGGRSKVLYTKEGRNSSVAITQWGDGAIEVDVNGHVEATTEPYDMKLQRTVGHLPAMLHPNPKSVLGIGFGAGVSAGTFTRYPGIEHITVCEIEPVIPPTSTRYFAAQDYDVLHNPRTRIVYDDARHYLMTTTDRFDIIASDPLDVFAKGTAALYSKEYFEAVKRHLNPGGYFSLYVPLYESDERTVRSEVATFMDAFPNGTIWSNTVEGRGYDMVFLGQVPPLRVDLDEVRDRLARPDYAPVAQSLGEIGVHSVVDLFAPYMGGRADLEPWYRGAEVNRDRDLRLQYLAGWGINSTQEDTIYRRMMAFRRPPQGIFTGSPDNLSSLLYAISIQ